MSHNQEELQKHKPDIQSVKWPLQYSCVAVVLLIAQERMCLKLVLLLQFWKCTRLQLWIKLFKLSFSNFNMHSVVYDYLFMKVKQKHYSCTLSPKLRHKQAMQTN